MAVLFMGGEFGSFVPSGAGVDEVATNYDSSYARGSVSMDGVNATPDLYYIESASWAAQTGAFYLHFRERSDGLGLSEHNLVTLHNSSGTTIFRIRQDYVAAGTRTFQLQYLNSGGAFANAGAVITTGQGPHNCDFYVNITSGEMAFYISGTQMRRVTGLSLGHLSGVTHCRLFSDTLPRFLSEVIAASENTIGWRLITRHANGTGGETGWTGTYTSIDELVTNDADFISAASTGLRETFTQTGPSVPSNYQVKAVALGIRGKAGTTVTGVKGLLRIGGANYASSTFTLGSGYTANCPVWETNPATSAAWAVSDLSSLEFGVESA